ncbi:hypothetical protein BH10ACI2_BH10ACI2_17270 [soil metagenome]
MKKLVMYLPVVKVVFVVLAIMELAVAVSVAQSGRNIPKRPQTAPDPVATPEPPPVAKPRPTPLVSVRVIADIQPDNYFAFPKPEYMLNWAIDRMRNSSLINVRDGGFENRRDAINQAEKETDTYVVLLQLEVDQFSQVPMASRPAAGQVWIYLDVLSPGTGKMKYNKRIVLNEERRDPKIPPPIVRRCYPGIFGNDALLLDASIKAAEYVMSSFSIPIPPDCPQKRGDQYESQDRHFSIF